MVWRGGVVGVVWSGRDGVVGVVCGEVGMVCSVERWCGGGGVEW